MSPAAMLRRFLWNQTCSILRLNGITIYYNIHDFNDTYYILTDKLQFRSSTDNYISDVVAEHDKPGPLHEAARLLELLLQNENQTGTSCQLVLKRPFWDRQQSTFGFFGSRY